MALPEPAPPPANTDDEHTAIVCMRCPDCGEIIREFKVVRGRRESNTVKAECPNCRWTAQAQAPDEALERTSLALPMKDEPAPLPTAYDPTTRSPLDVPASPPPRAFDLSAPIFPSAPEAAHLDAEGDLHVAEDAEIDVEELEQAELLLEQSEAQACAGVLPSTASAPPSLSYPSGRSDTRQLRRTRREAWLLTVLCFIALGAGALELVLLAKQLSAWTVGLLIGLLLPATGVMLVHGLRGLWRTTKQ
jgi:predicted RNA-binding Zn-ribbon protein involved in translation (DUF1610 family)